MQTTKVQRIKIQSIDFSSFMKISVYLGFTLGLLSGAFSLIVSLFGVPVYANIGAIKATGVLAGVMSLFLGPLIFSVLFAIAGLFVYFPIKWMIALIKGIVITGRIEVYHTFDTIIKEGEAEPLPEMGNIQ